jgi:uncharacterized membrane protein
MKIIGRLMQWSGPVVSIGYITAVMVLTEIRDKEFLAHCLVGSVIGHTVVFIGNIVFALGEKQKNTIDPERYFY